VQYPTEGSNSGAYIFASYTEEFPLSLFMTDSMLIESDVEDKVIVIYKSHYNTVQASLTMFISKDEGTLEF
jgi:hypothetical protein